MAFIPLAAESLGAWHVVATAEICKLGRVSARNTGQEEGEAVSQLHQWLSLLLIKGNSILFTNWSPSN